MILTIRKVLIFRKPIGNGHKEKRYYKLWILGKIEILEYRKKHKFGFVNSIFQDIRNDFRIVTSIILQVWIHKRVHYLQKNAK